MRAIEWTFLFLAAYLCAGETANAAAIEEPFNYPAGSSLLNQNGGVGWSGAWYTPGGLDATITAGSLAFGNVPVSGGAGSTAGFQPPNQGSSVATWLRSLGTQLGADNTTAYLSFLLRPDAGFGFYGGVNFGSVFVGLSGSQAFYGLEGAGNDISLSSVSAVSGQTVLFVLRADFRPGADTLSLFINPNPGQPEPALASVIKTNLDLGLIDSLTINNYGGFTTDEIRIASTFASVTPGLSAVPEPSSGWAAGLAVLLLLCRRICAAKAIPTRPIAN